MRTSIRVSAAVAAVILAVPAAAQSGRTPSLSAFAAPLPPGTGMLHVQGGWPGLWATYLHGLSPRASGGARFALNYGFEGETGQTVLGIKMQGVFRLGLMESDRFDVGVELAPGLLMYFPSGLVQWGISVPVTVVMGIPLSDAFTVHLAVDAPMAVTFTVLPSFFLPLYFGGGLEYALDKTLLLTFALRMGPFINTRFGRASFGLNALLGVAFKI